MSKPLIRLTCATALALMLVPATALAATPSQGSLGRQTASLGWTGSFDAPNPVTCTGDSDPACDLFKLYVNPQPGQDVRVAVSAPAGQDIDLHVYAPDGSRVPSENSDSSAESATIHAPKKGTYRVRVQPFLVEPGTDYRGAARFIPAEAHPAPAEDREIECLEPIPESVSVRDVTDEGQTVNLTTVVLLDGAVTWARGNDAMKRAADAYRPLGINLTARYRRVAFTGTDAQGLINQAKALWGGKRPSTADLVYVLTDKDIQAGGNTAVAGMADCIGGVRFADQAFAVGEVWQDEDLVFGPVRFYADTTAKIAAHELGHLMGGHHHYGNCAEGTKSQREVEEVSPCTLMFNFVDFQSIHFSTVNAQVVRGHAVDFASP